MGSRVARRNFVALTTESIAYALASQLTAAAVVLPFVCIAFGGTPFAAALIYPVYTATGLLGAIYAPHVLGRMPVARALALLLALTAIVFATTATGIALLEPGWLNGLWAVAGVLGLLSGMSSIAVVHVMASSLEQPQRATLSIAQSTGGAILTLAVTAVLALLFLDPNGKSGHLALLWAGAAAIGVAALALLPVGPLGAKRVEIARVGIVAAIRSRPDKAYPWVRQFLTAQALFLSISLATSFYSTHGAVLHGQKIGSLHTIVAVTALGSLAFSALWTLTRKRATIRGLMFTAANLGVFSAVMALIGDYGGGAALPVVSGLVIALSAAGGLATSSTRSSWMYQNLGSAGDTAVIVFCQVVMGVVATIVGLIFSTFAHVDSVIPTWGMLALSCSAMVHALRLPRVRVADSHAPAPSHAPHPGGHA